MKKLLIVIAVIAISFSEAMGQVGIGNMNPDPSALVEVNSTTRGLLPTRMTYAQLCAVPSPQPGMVIFCTDCSDGSGCLYAFEGGGWHCSGERPIFQTSCGSEYNYYPIKMVGYYWFDRNLGASHVATSLTDYQAYGSHYQWGRKADGHQCITWTSSTTGNFANGATLTQCNSSTCPNALFVKRTSATYDWITPYNNTLWNGTTKGANDPCPPGYRVPTLGELTALEASFSPSNQDGAFASPLKLTLSGNRKRYDATLASAGVTGTFWSSTYYNYGNQDWAYYLNFTQVTADLQTDYKATGFTIRCIRE